MNISDIEKSLKEYNQSSRINYKKIKTKRIKSLDGKVITQYYYNNKLILERW